MVYYGVQLLAHLLYKALFAVEGSQVHNITARFVCLETAISMSWAVAAVLTGFCCVQQWLGVHEALTNALQSCPLNTAQQNTCFQVQCQELSCSMYIQVSWHIHTHGNIIQFILFTLSDIVWRNKSMYNTHNVEHIQMNAVEQQYKMKCRSCIEYNVTVT